MDEETRGGVAPTGVPLVFALCEVKRLRDMIAFLGKLLASARGERRLGWSESRTKDTVLEVTYPGININELRSWKKDLEGALDDLQSRIKRTNWTSGIQQKLERLSKLDREIKRVTADITRNVRLFEDEVEHAPNVVELLQVVQALYSGRSHLSYEVQQDNLEFRVPIGGE